VVLVCVVFLTLKPAFLSFLILRSQPTLPFDRCQPYGSGREDACSTVSGTGKRGMEHAGLDRPSDDHHGRCLVGFDELYADRVVSVD
jgi:hypothetical protein